MNYLVLVLGLVLILVLTGHWLADNVVDFGLAVIVCGGGGASIVIFFVFIFGAVGLDFLLL